MWYHSPSVAVCVCVCVRVNVPDECTVCSLQFPVRRNNLKFSVFQMNDKDSPSETEADTTDQLASKQQQHSQSKLLANKEQPSSGLADDTQLTIALQAAAAAAAAASDAMQSQQNKVNADAFYPEANFVNASDSQVSTQQEHELETRLK